MTGPDDPEAFERFAAELRQTLAKGYAPAEDVHTEAAAEAWQIDSDFFAEHPTELHHVRPALPHEICQAAGWCREDPLEDLPPCPMGVTRELVAIITRSDGDDGARTKAFRAQLIPLEGGET